MSWQEYQAVAHRPRTRTTVPTAELAAFSPDAEVRVAFDDGPFVDIWTAREPLGRGPETSLRDLYPPIRQR